MPLWETVVDLDAQAQVVRRRRYGVIEAIDGRVTSVRFRPLPKRVTLPEALVWGPWRHRRWQSDCCRLYFNQPRQFPNFLSLPYLFSGNRTCLATIYAALAALDEVARIKRSDAILADVQNYRISPRLLARQGWEPHKPRRWSRHYIKRFYGEYGSRPMGGPALEEQILAHSASEASCQPVG